MPDRSLSWQHAQFTWTEDGVWLEDLGSTNGTQVNRKKLKKRVQIGPEDTVRLGSVGVLLYLPGEGPWRGPAAATVVRIRDPSISPGVMSLRVLRVVGLLLLANLYLGCGSCQNSEGVAARSVSAEPELPPWSAQSGVPRVVAIGDLHGDVSAARAALMLAGAMDAQERWIGGALVVVQTGDQVDRGDDDRAVLDLFHRLAAEAKKSGGQAISLLGNHETMNVQGQMEYVTDKSFRGFTDVAGLDMKARWLAAFPQWQRARRAAFAPGGPYARLLAQRDTVVQIGDTVFAHGGVLPEHVCYGLARINQENKAWMRGGAPQPKLIGRQGPLWSRLFSRGALDADQCASLSRVLKALSAKRMVVGHTIQPERISSACEGTVWRIDVGMSRHYGRSVQVLELSAGSPKVLEEQKSSAAKRDPS